MLSLVIDKSRTTTARVTTDEQRVQCHLKMCANVSANKPQ